jgi:sec-independent protein translocase protein TatA
MQTLAVTVPGGAEWLIILLIFVLLFGAKKLPELGSSVGRSIKNFKKGVDEAEPDETGDVDDVVDSDETSPASRDNT